MSTGDHFTYRPRPLVPDPAVADPEAICRSFVHTLESMEVCRRILDRLVPSPAARVRPVLLAGPYGVGKTHLLRYLACAISDPGGQAWKELESRLGKDLGRGQPLESVFIDLPADSAADIEDALLAGMGVPESSRRDRPDFGRALADAARDLANRGVALLVADGLSRRLETCPEPGACASDAKALEQWAACVSSAGILPALTGDDDRIRPGQRWGTTPPLASLASQCDVLHLSRKSIVDIVASGLTFKEGECRNAVEGILARLKAQLPGLRVDHDDFVGLYPIHPSVIGALLRVRAALPQFSPLGFLQGALEPWRELPEDRLITLDVLFDAVLPALRQKEAFRGLLSSYQVLFRRSRALFRGAVQPKCEALLTGLAFVSVFEPEPWDLRSLASALVLYDETGTIPGYGLASALLDRLVEAAGRHLAVEGSDVERRCRLLELAPGSSDAGPPGEGLPHEFLDSAAAPQRLDRSSATASREASPKGTEAEQQSSLRWFERLESASGRGLQEIEELARTLPEAFLTHAVWERIRSIESRLDAVRRIGQASRDGEIGPHEAGARLARVFGGDEALFASWAEALEDFGALLGWTAVFEKARTYVLGTCVTGSADVDALREGLRDRIAQPHRFFPASGRLSFEREFLHFKERYVDVYARHHLSARELSASPGGSGTGVDEVGLRNIELLSGLPQLDRSHVLRVRALARRVQQDRCQLPVREILAVRPRCLCGFNPAGGRQAGNVIGQLNVAIRDGVERLRAALRARSGFIIQELQRLAVPPSEAQPIAALLRRGTMLPMTPESIDILGRILASGPDVPQD